MLKVYLNRLNKNQIQEILPYRQVRINSAYTVSANLFMASYLAGLIEGDGHIAVHDKNSSSKKFRAKFIITFNLADKPLVDKLSAVLKVGKVISKPSAGHVILQILAKDEVLKTINLINGYMCTPKLEALHRAITWINEKDSSSISCLGLDLSAIGSNSWLAGFTDAWLR